MPDRRAAAAEAAGTCKHCQRSVFRRGDGSLAHERRAADPPPADETPPPGDEPKGDEAPPPDVPPRREHLLHRRVIGRG